MKKFNSFKSIALAPALVLAVGLAVQPAYAEDSAAGSTRYITDSIEIPLRSGASLKYRIKRMVPSGTEVKILEVDQAGWAKILYKGSEGWLPANLLENQPVAKDRLATQIQKTSSVEAKFNDLKLELSTLQTRFDETSTELKNIKQEKFEITQELNRLKDVSSNAVQLDEQNQAMKARLSNLEDENAIMREQIDQAEDVVKRQWFLTGGGVLLLGLLLGRFFRVPGKRKKWGEL
ncbi:MAG: TIGR04211 family SH3 domain-containing protein [Thiotrichales bacterium]|nr:TIGR04211 family SH3 domain-containing protein [Thiotrichales bacterium]